MDIAILSQHGINYDKGLARCMNDPDFYECILQLFLEDDTLTQAYAALDGHDYATLFKHMHALKGVAGNAELTALYAAACAITEALRSGTAAEEEIRPLFECVVAAYDRAREGIQLASR